MKTCEGFFSRGETFLPIAAKLFTRTTSQQILKQPNIYADDYSKELNVKSIILPLALAVAATTGTFVLTPATALAGPTYTGVKGGNVAVGGYDVTSYFTGNGVPVKGSKTHRVKYKGADYFFTSAANAEKFKEKPAMFVPQYGGHCAWAMSRGSLAPGDPTVDHVVNGKLYLNVNKQVQKTWLTDVAGFIKKADLNWPKFPDDAKFGG